jgi:hypothetical protein
MMQGSFTWNDTRDYESDFTLDRTNIVPVNLVDGYNRDIRYVIKLNGLVSLPKGFNASVTSNIQDGGARGIFYRAPSRISSNRNGGLGTFDFRVEPIGTTHQPTLTMTDLQVDKSFRFGRNRLNLTWTLFNVFNVATIRGYASGRLDQTAAFSRVSSIVPPRVFRVMARWSF